MSQETDLNQQLMDTAKNGDPNARGEPPIAAAGWHRRPPAVLRPSRSPRLASPRAAVFPAQLDF